MSTRKVETFYNFERSFALCKQWNVELTCVCVRVHSVGSVLVLYHIILQMLGNFVFSTRTNAIVDGMTYPPVYNWMVIRTVFVIIAD